MPFKSVPFSDSADGIHQIQLLDDPDIEAIQYLMSFDRGYTWGSQDLGILPDQQSMPNVSWPISSGDSPLLLDAELNGISFTLALQSFEVATKGSTQLEAGLKFNPGAYNYSPVDVGGKTYYMGLVGDNLKYYDKYHEIAYSEIGTVAAQATIVAPELAPVTGPIAFGAALGEFYYSDDRWGTLGKFVGSYLFGKAYKNIGREAGMPAGNQIRMESLGGCRVGILLKKCYLINDFLIARLSNYKKNLVARLLIISLVSLLFYWFVGERLYLAVFLGFAFEFSTLDLIFNREFMNLRLYVEFFAKKDLVDDWSFLVSVFIYFLFWGGALIYGVSRFF